LSEWKKLSSAIDIFDSGRTKESFQSVVYMSCVSLSLFLPPELFGVRV
jgi:hypothetical protein